MGKVCTGCGEFKLRSAYHRQTRAKDGLQVRCKKCRNATNRQYLRDDPERVRRYGREKQRRLRGTPEGIVRAREKNRAHYRANPQRRVEQSRRSQRLNLPGRDARNAINHAITAGLLVPAEYCDECGHDFSSHRREAHHDDYGKPFEVLWLCSRCHGMRHRID